MPLQARNNTARKILDKSIQLFNRHGVFQVSVQRISDALKLRSVGNITYYFKKKNDIIHAIIDQLETELVEKIENSPKEFRAETVAMNLADFLVDLQLILWRYRFVFNNMAFLSAADKTFGRRYMDLQEHVLNTLTATARMATSKGWMLPVNPPNSIELIIENQWNIWLRSLSAAQLRTPRAKNTKADIVYNSLLHYYSLMETHIAAKVRDDLYAHIQNKYCTKIAAS